PPPALQPRLPLTARVREPTLRRTHHHQPITCPPKRGNLTPSCWLVAGERAGSAALACFSAASAGRSRSACSTSIAGVCSAPGRDRRGRLRRVSSASRRAGGRLELAVRRRRSLAGGVFVSALAFALEGGGG